MAATYNNIPVVTQTVDRDRPFKLFGSATAFCFVAALATDIVYARVPDMVWTTFSNWLITIGLILAGIAVVVGLIDRVVHHRFGALSSRWMFLAGFAAAVVVELFNAFVHQRDAYESVVPTGITLSVVAVALLVLAWIVGSTQSSRTRKSL